VLKLGSLGTSDRGVMLLGSGMLLRH